MIYEIQKAFEALLHPGIDSNPIKLIRNAIPYYLSPKINAFPPLTIYWSINNVCNLRCKMCDVGMSNDQGTFYKHLRIDNKLHEIDIKVFKAVIDEVAQDKPFIAIISTEPLLYKHLTEAIAYCTQKGLATAVSTGGYTLPKLAEDLARAGLQRLNVSIDGPPHVHNDIRGRKDSFERSIAGMWKFYEASKQIGHKSQIYINYVISNMNFQYITEFADIVEELPITSLNFTYFWCITDSVAEEQNRLYGNTYPVSTSCYNEYTQFDGVDIEMLFAQIKRLKKRKNVRFLPLFSKDDLFTYFRQPDRFIKKDAGCLASWFFAQILADGRVVTFTRCHNQAFGNINEQSFYKIWNGDAMKRWRTFIKQHGRMPMCKRCDLVF